jgi:hypothetical protein
MTIIRWAARVLLVILVGLVVVGLAPFLLRERPASGGIPDSHASVVGQAQTVVSGLRGLGYSCSDAQEFRDLRTGLCSRTRYLSSAEVRLLTSPADGTVHAVGLAVAEGSTSTELLSEILQVLGEAVGLTDTDRSAVLSAVSDRATAPVQPSWGTFRPAVDGEAESMLEASGWDEPLPALSPSLLKVPMAQLTTQATERGYVCETPQIGSIRSCTRSADGYFYDLWMEGTDSAVASLYLSVTSTYHTRTRSHWVEELGVVLSGVETDQGRMLESWVRQSAYAPGGSAYVAGLHISFLVRIGEYTKETVGSVTSDCYQLAGDLSRCAG